MLTYREQVTIRRKRERLEPDAGISDVVFHKKYLNKVTNDIRDSAVGVYQLARFFRFRGHFATLKKEVERLLNLLPFMKDFILVEEKNNERRDTGKLVFTDYKYLSPDGKPVAPAVEDTFPKT